MNIYSIRYGLQIYNHNSIDRNYDNIIPSHEYIIYIWQYVPKLYCMSNQTVIKIIENIYNYRSY